MTICLVQRQKAFLRGYRLRVRELEKELERTFQIGKKMYYNQVEQKLLGTPNYVCVWPYYELGTCPGCNPPFTL